MSSLPRRAALLLAATLFAACAGDPARLARGRAVVEAESLVASRRRAEAEAAARALLARADLDDDHRCATLLALGRALAGQGRGAEALDALSDLGRRCPDHPASSARGLLEVADLAATAGAPGARQRILERVVVAFPDDPSAARAVSELAEALAARDGPDAAVARLASLHARVPGRAAAARLLFEAARIRGFQGTPDARAEALVLYGRLADTCPASPLANDAQVEAARLALELGRPGEAERRLEALLAQRQWSFLLGSYEIGLYAEAQLLLGDAVLADGRPRDAADRWLDLARRWPRDRRVPAALLRAADALRRAGDEQAARDVLERLARDHPRSDEARRAGIPR